MKAVVFDIGNVLVRWDPRCAFRKPLGCDAAVDAFFERTDFFRRNRRADRGERFSALAQEIADPDDRALFAAYADRFAMTVLDPIEGTWAILNRLRRQGTPVHAITNWAAETWPVGLTLHPRLQDAFDVLIVSGEVRLIKPDREIFDLFCDRAKTAPEDCVFVDDSRDNVEAARAAGMDAVRFTTPDALAGDLGKRGML